MLTDKKARRAHKIINDGVPARRPPPRAPPRLRRIRFAALAREPARMMLLPATLSRARARRSKDAVIDGAPKSNVTSSCSNTVECTARLAACKKPRPARAKPTNATTRQVPRCARHDPCHTPTGFAEIRLRPEERTNIKRVIKRTVTTHEDHRSLAPEARARLLQTRALPTPAAARTPPGTAAPPE